MKKLIVFLITLLAGTVMSANKYIPYYFAGESTDSVMIVKYCITTPAWDTVTVSAFPATDSFIIDSTQDYSGFYRYFYDGDTTLPSLVGQFFIKGTASTTSDTLAIARAVTRDIVDSAIIRTDVFYGPSMTGSGIYQDTIFVVDSSAAPDVALQDVMVCVYNAAGTWLYQSYTNANGRIIFELPVGTYEFRMFDVQYAHDSSIHIVAATDTDTLLAYEAVATADKSCNVSVWCVDNAGNPAQDVMVSAYLMKSRVVDSAGRVIQNIIRNARTDSTGVATIACTWSTYLLPETQWIFRISDSRIGVLQKPITVPRTNNYTLTLNDLR